MKILTIVPEEAQEAKPVRGFRKKLQFRIIA